MFIALEEEKIAKSFTQAIFGFIFVAKFKLILTKPSGSLSTPGLTPNSAGGKFQPWNLPRWHILNSSQSCQ